MAQRSFQHSVRIEDPPIARLLFSDTRLAWRVAGYWGVDHWLLPAFGVPGKPGTLFPLQAKWTGHEKIAT